MKYVLNEYVDDGKNAQGGKNSVERSITFINVIAFLKVSTAQPTVENGRNGKSGSAVQGREDGACKVRTIPRQSLWNDLVKRIL
jgi:hypothetical protein